jgi:triosephosphate isomerase
MTRRKLIAGNWKMNPTSLDEAVALAKAVATGASGDRGDVLVIPPTPFLSAVAQALAGSAVALGAQNSSPELKGAFTGEASGPMLRAVGARFVLCGHSERRQIFGESSELVGRKVQAALRDGLTPILCVGETLTEREQGITDQVVASQLEGGLAGLGADKATEVVIAYEPVWAIGTGKVASPEQAQAAHAAIRGWLVARFGNDTTLILYGGSVKADNAAELMSQPDVDGALVGGASLDAKGFLAIAAAC